MDGDAQADGRVGEVVAMKKRISPSTRPEVARKISLAMMGNTNGRFVTAEGKRRRAIAIRLKHSTHGETGKTITPEYRVWASMKNRCSNKRDTKNFGLYGANGITVCERWQTSYQRFLADVGRRPGPEYSLDRINSRGHYEPGNVRWATKSVQAKNQIRRSWKQIATMPCPKCGFARSVRTIWSSNDGITNAT